MPDSDVLKDIGRVKGSVNAPVKTKDIILVEKGHSSKGLPSGRVVVMKEDEEYDFGHSASTSQYFTANESYLESEEEEEEDEDYEEDYDEEEDD